MSELTQQKFKDIALQLHTFTKENAEPTLNQMQQALSQAMYSKPYEEVRETILSGKNIINVYLCNNKYYLFHKERYIKKIKKCDDENLKSELKRERIRNDGFNIVKIPVFTEEELYHCEDHYRLQGDDIIPSLGHVIYMIEKMGYFNPLSIFDEFRNCDYFFISEFDKKNECIHEDIYSDEKPCDDWFANVEMEGEDALVMIIEEPNIEETLTFRDLIEAKFNGESWYIDYGDGGISIQFCYKK